MRRNDFVPPWMRRLACAVVLMTLPGCELLPERFHTDGDGSSATPTQLELNRSRSDELHCSSAGGDCSDWFALEIPSTGELSLRVEAQAGSEPRGALSLRLHAEEPTDSPLAASRCSGTAACEIRRTVGSGRHLIELEVDPGSHFRYVLHARLRSDIAADRPPGPTESRGRAPSPTPMSTAVAARIIEFEERPGGTQAVVLDLGEADGMTVGLRGRLLRGRDSIAEIEVREVYPDGSRAQILEGAAGDITKASSAEVDLPHLEAR